MQLFRNSHVRKFYIECEVVGPTCLLCAVSSTTPIHEIYTCPQKDSRLYCAVIFISVYLRLMMVAASSNLVDCW